jgi:hypothetical protein
MESENIFITQDRIIKANGKKINIMEKGNILNKMVDIMRVISSREKEKVKESSILMLIIGTKGNLRIIKDMVKEYNYKVVIDLKVYLLMVKDIAKKE